MPTLSSYAYLTIAEATKREGFDAGSLGELMQVMDFYSEVPWLPATHGTNNKQTQATRLGAGAFAKANSPITIISSSAEEITEPVKLYEGDSAVDERVLKGADNPTKVRDSEDMLNMTGLAQDWLYQLFYTYDYSTTDAFKSLRQRRAATTANRTWTFSGTGGGDLTDLWLFEFGPRAFYLGYNPNSTPGFANDDRGRQLATAPTGTGQFWAWMRHYEIWAAIVLRDDRALQRGINIETTGSSSIFDPAICIQMKNQLPSFGASAVFFANRTLKAQIDNNAYAKTNAAYSIRDIQDFGPVTYVSGVPVRVHEGIPNTLSTGGL